MKKIINENICPIYVIGGNHHNMLGIIRMLGEVGIRSRAIIKGDPRFSFCKKSKYLDNCEFVNTDEEMYELLQKIEVRSIVIPTGDESAYLLDKYYDRLSEKLLLPSIDKKANQMSNYMDKYYQNIISKKMGIKVVESQEIDLAIFKENQLILKYPIILKPQLSIEGHKEDITIVENSQELIIALAKFRDNGYTQVLAQEFIKMDYECGLNGIVYEKEVVIPAVLRKIRIYPTNRGNVSFGEIINPDECNLDLEPIKKLLIALNYSGFYDIELFVIGSEYYLNEINFRNSGNSYVYTKGNVNLALLWVFMTLGYSTENIAKKVNKNYYFVDELGEAKQLTSKNITIGTYLKSNFKSKCYFLMNLRDIKPFLFKIISSFKKKVGVIKDE